MGVSNCTKPFGFSHKVASGVDVGNLVCARGAGFARLRSNASSIVKLNFTGALQRVLHSIVKLKFTCVDCTAMAASMLWMAALVDAVLV